MSIKSSPSTLLFSRLPLRSVTFALLRSSQFHISLLHFSISYPGYIYRLIMSGYGNDNDVGALTLVPSYFFGPYPLIVSDPLTELRRKPAPSNPRLPTSIKSCSHKLDEPYAILTLPSPAEAETHTA